jgi:pimeloyl-ACP methyl ester carboxylesterase
VRRPLPACLFLLAGCSTAGFRPEVYRAASPPASPSVGVVFVANGSGDFRTVSTNLCQAVADATAPLQVETFVWSRGYGRYVLDHTDHANHLAQGRRLATQVAAYRQSCPGQRVYLVGHSAGCAVVLAAAEVLPPDGVDRIVLLTRRCAWPTTCGPPCAPPGAASTSSTAARTA